MSLEALAAPSFAIELPERRLTLSDLLARARSVESEIVAQPGEVVELPARDPVALLTWIEACWRTGRVPLPRLDVRVPRRVSLPTTDAALVLRTSGSTGEPKHPEFELGAVQRSARRIAKYLGLHRDDRVALMQPVDSGFGLVGQLLAAASAGATVIPSTPVFPDERVAALHAARASVLSGVPFLLAQLVEAGVHSREMRVVGVAGAALPPSLAARLEEVFPEATIWSQYGCTEAGPRLTAIETTASAYASGSAGRAIEGVSLHICDNGEVAFETDTAMRGYLGDEPATKAARVGRGWRTGDLGELTSDGHLQLTGRVDDVVKVRGLKVSLAAVVEAVESCGASAAVALAPPELDGICVLVEGSLPSKGELVRKLPLESMPSRMHQVAALPRLASGKIDRIAAARLCRELR